MRWLITVHVDYDAAALSDAVAAAEGMLREEDPIPLGDDELALFADGPVDLPVRLQASSDVVKVSPDSEPTAY